MVKRNPKMKVIALILFCSALVFSPFFDTVNSGKVQAAGPKVITTAAELNNIRHDMEGDYVLGADIDLDVAPYNKGAGWEPIGTRDNRFKGTFDGKGHTIRGLMIDRGGLTGLFGRVAGSVTISNVTLENVQVKGGNNTGALVGEMSHKGLIENVTVTGSINGVSSVGGIVGWSINSKIKNSHVKNIKVSGKNDVGGLAGAASGEIIGSTSGGTVEATGRNVGGLAGAGENIEDSSSSAKVISYFTSSHAVYNSNAGGLVGDMNVFSGKVTNSYATGDVEAIHDNVGGLIGYLRSSTKVQVTNSYATGDVTGRDRVGGLVGHFKDTLIDDSYATGNVYGENGVGGLVGLQESKKATIQKSYATGNVTSTGDRAGGLVGELIKQAKIQNAYARGTVTGENDVGGLVGDNKASTIQRAYATGKVTGQSKTGGLVGNDLKGKYSSVAPNYFDKATTGMDDPKGATAESTADMQTRTTFKGWNFTTTWKINLNEYPTFRDQPFDVITDVPSHHWGRDDITEIVEKQIMRGSPDPKNDGKFVFKPADNITRAEFAIVIVNALGETGTETNTGFADDNKIPSWAKKEVAKAKELNIVKGDQRGRFNPSKQISRAEIATMVARAYGLTGGNPGSLTFVDANDIPFWAKKEVAAVVDSKIMQGQNGNRFAPRDSAKRVEAGVTALRAFNKYTQ